MQFLRWAAVSTILFTTSPVDAADDFFLSSRKTGNAGYSYFPSPADWRDVNMYQLFTDRFNDGNKLNNNVRGWYTTDSYRHYAMGGDWKGVQDKLDYLQGMGVKAVWISGVQINEQGSDKRYAPYHAYHPTDFYRVEPMFGTFQELKNLIDDAHGRGMYIILDVVINHMADLNGLGDGKDGYYHAFGGGDLRWWSDKKHAWPLNDLKYFHNNGKIVNYGDYWQALNGQFVGTDDLKTEDPFVRDHLTAAFKNLIDATDCDGFRVDAIKHVEKDAFLQPWADAMRKHAASLGKNNFILFGENFDYNDNNVAEHCKSGYGMNSALYFPMQLTIKEVFAYEQGTKKLSERRGNIGVYGAGQNNLVSFMDNHDVDRIALECGDSWNTKLKAALAYLYTATPVPCLYYGTEQGFNQGWKRNNGSEDGDYQRECMFDYGYQPGNAWGDNFKQSDLYAFIKKLNELRTAHPCLTRGDFNTRWQEDGKGLYAYTRALNGEEALVVLNTDWSQKSCTPSVGKPDGTKYVNMLDLQESATVSGGKLSVSVGSKGVKIFIAGGAKSVVETSCSKTQFFINYKPGSGPLSNAVGQIHIGIGRDGNKDIIDRAMTKNGDTWQFSYSITNATNDVTFWFHDEKTPAPTYDNNGNMNWVVDIKGCGKTGKILAWVGNTAHFPAAGQLDVGEDLWVDIESYPQGAAVEGEVVFSADGGTTWTNKALAPNGKKGQNDAWNANLGTFGSSKTVKFALKLSGDNGDVWANNGGSNFSVKVNSNITPVSFAGNTYHWPPNGEIDSDEDLWLNIESRPLKAGVTGAVVYTTDNGATWKAATLSRNGTNTQGDLWNVKLGKFAAKTTVKYALNVADADGIEVWSNNGGSNFTAVVNERISSLKWYGSTRNFSTKRPGVRSAVQQADNRVSLSLETLKNGVTYSVCMSSNLMAWTAVDQFAASSNATTRTVSGGEKAFFCLRVDHGAASDVSADEEMLVSVETWPQGGAAKAAMVYSADGGTTWKSTAMTRTGVSGNNDVWSASLGSHSAGTVIKYAVELTDDAGVASWDNNNHADYSVTVK